MNELAALFWVHAKQHYRRPDGTPTNELSDYRLSLRPLKHLYGDRLVIEFGPLALKAVRQMMIDGYLHPKYGPQGGLARKVVNQRIGRVRRMFAWGVENELAPASVAHALREVRGLQAGRSKARETEPVRPGPPAFVDETVPQLLPPVQVMVRLQQLTGMRPGEVVVMRGIDLDASGKVWLYRPGSDLRAEGQHKTAHHGHQRIIAIGPQAQGVLRPWLRLNVQEYLFQPREAREQMDAERKASRKTPFTPSQAMRKRKSRPKRVLQERYTTASYGKAIARDIERANYTRLCDGCKEALKARRKAEGKSAQIDPCAGCHPALVQ